MTGQSIEERLQVVREIFLVTTHNKSVYSADTAKSDIYCLVAAILEDKDFSCNSKQRCVQVLKKSPVWEKVKPFLVNNDNSCARGKCHCGSYAHTKGKGKCSGNHYKRTGGSGGWKQVPCECQGFIAREF